MPIANSTGMDYSKIIVTKWMVRHLLRNVRSLQDTLFYTSSMLATKWEHTGTTLIMEYVLRFISVLATELRPGSIL
jgi:hypothetical protein